MSLARIALRIAAVEAIKGKTWVGDNVLDSPNGALDIQVDGRLRTEQEKPFISVYTDYSKNEDIRGRSLTETGTCDLVIEIGVSTAMLEKDRQTGQTRLVGIDIPASDRNREFFLDIVQRQIFDALNDPGNEWSDIYRGLHRDLLRVEFAGARSTDDGQRLTGHQIRLTVDLVNDPVKGVVLKPQSPFRRFLNAIEETGDAVYGRQAQTMRGIIEGVQTGVDGAVRRYGLTRDEAGALQMAAPDGVDEDTDIAGVVSAYPDASP